MIYKNFDELLDATLCRVNVVNNFASKTPEQNLILSLYKGIKDDFVKNLEMIMLFSDYKIEKKQLKYMLRKTKRMRTKSWKMYMLNIKDSYYNNEIDMFNFNYDDIIKDVQNIPLYSSKTIFGMHLRNKEKNPLCARHEPAHLGTESSVAEEITAEIEQNTDYCGSEDNDYEKDSDSRLND